MTKPQRGSIPRVGCSCCMDKHDDKVRGPTLLDKIIAVGGELLEFFIDVQAEIGRTFLLVIGLLVMAFGCFILAWFQ